MSHENWTEVSVLCEEAYCGESCVSAFLPPGQKEVMFLVVLVRLFVSLWTTLLKKL